MIERLWLKIRITRLGGWNPFYSATLHFNEIIKDWDFAESLRRDDAGL